MKYKAIKRQSRGRWSFKRSVLLVLTIILAGSLIGLSLKPGSAKADITLVATNTASGTNTTSVTVNKPTGTANGNLMLATLTFYSSRSRTITVPTGWTRISAQLNTGSYYQDDYYKVAGASEPTSYTWSFSGSVYSTLGIQSYSGVSTSSPIDNSAGQTNTSSTTPNAPSVAANASGDLLVVVFGYGRVETATAFGNSAASLYNITAGTSGSTTGNGQSVATKALTSSGSTGTTSSTVGTAAVSTAYSILLKSAQASVGITFVAANTPATCSSSCSSISPTMPTGWKAGDLLITTIDWNNTTALSAVPSGWTQIDTTQTTSSSYSEAEFYHISATGDPSSYSWTFGANPGEAIAASIDFRGVDSAIPIDVSATAADTTGTSHNAPSVTTTYPSDMLFDVWSNSNGVSSSTHTSTLTQGWTQTVGSSASGIGTWSGYEPLGNPGSTGTRNITTSRSGASAMHSVALHAYLPSPTLLAPADGNTDEILSPVFKLVNVSLTASPLKYKIQLCSTSNCSTIISTFDQTLSQTGWSGQDQLGGTAYTGGTTVDTSTTATYTAQTPLTAGTQYWWRAFSYDTGSGTYSLQSAIATFTTSYVPSAPTLFYPQNNGTGLPLQPEFQLAATDTDANYLEYKIQLCSDSLCNTVLRTIDQTADQTGWSGQDANNFTAYASDPTTAANSTTAYYDYPFSDIVPQTQYYWRAYAIDPSGTNTWSAASAIQSFTVNKIDVRILNGVIKSGVIK